jgi:cell division septum initiation protein DivIVA
MSADSPRDLSRKQKDLRVITAERLEAIVEAAERAAESVIDDAEAQARRYLSQARAEADRAADDRTAELSELVDSLLGQAIAVRQGAERLQASLEDARNKLEGEERQPDPERRQDPPEPPQPEVPRLRAVGESEERDAEDARRADASGARLLATQLAVSGSSREEIELRLRNGFQIEDTDAILDAILGPED